MRVKYLDGSAIGSHEASLQKICEFKIDVPYIVTYVSKQDSAVFIDFSKEKSIFLNKGMVISTEGIINSNDSRIEIKNLNGYTYRLMEQSEISFEHTVEGIKPVYYGDVAVISSEKYNPLIDGGKYRTSCWNSTTGNFLVRTEGDGLDKYVTLGKSLSVYEYDESGRKFEIFKMPEYTEFLVKFDKNKSMRERYRIVSKRKLTNKELAKLHEQYIFPENWE